MNDGMETFADLFCGIGGFHHAAAAHGMKCVFACDNDVHAARQYEHAFGMPVSGDIAQIDPEGIPDHDMLFAGFPCQPFSIIGKRRGMDDSRGTLIRHVADILAVKRPKAFVLENVPQLETNDEMRSLERMRDMLADAGYISEHRVFNARDFGLPHNRRRLIMVGFRDPAVGSVFEWPVASGRPMAPLGAVLESDPDPRHSASPEIQEKRRAAHTAAESPSIWHENKSGNVSSHPFSCALRANASHNYLLVDGVRRLTPREMLRLQGFPESFEIVGSDSQLRRQAGNAVPVPMVREVIGKAIEAHGKHAAAVRKAKANGWRTEDDVDDAHAHVIEKGTILESSLFLDGEKFLIEAKRDIRIECFFVPGDEENPNGYYGYRHPAWGASAMGVDDTRELLISQIHSMIDLHWGDLHREMHVPPKDRRRKFTENDRIDRAMRETFGEVGNGQG